MLIPGICRRQHDTVVWAHSNRLEDGKAMGLKARDSEGCYACFDCHSFYDGGYAGKIPREQVEAYFDVARARSQDILRQLGLL